MCMWTKTYFHSDVPAVQSADTVRSVLFVALLISRVSDDVSGLATREIRNIERGWGGEGMGCSDSSHLMSYLVC